MAESCLGGLPYGDRNGPVYRGTVGGKKIAHPSARCVCVPLPKKITGYKLVYKIVTLIVIIPVKRSIGWFFVYKSNFWQSPVTNAYIITTFSLPRIRAGRAESTFGVGRRQDDWVRDTSDTGKHDSPYSRHQWMVLPFILSVCIVDDLFVYQYNKPFIYILVFYNFYYDYLFGY